MSFKAILVRQTETSVMCQGVQTGNAIDASTDLLLLAPIAEGKVEREHTWFMLPLTHLRAADQFSSATAIPMQTTSHTSSPQSTHEQPVLARPKASASSLTVMAEDFERYR